MSKKILFSFLALSLLLICSLSIGPGSGSSKKGSGHSQMRGIESSFSSIPYSAQSITWESGERATLEGLRFAQGSGSAQSATLEGETIKLLSLSYSGIPQVEIDEVNVSAQVTRLRAQEIAVTARMPWAGVTRSIRVKKLSIMPQLITMMLPKLQSKGVKVPVVEVPLKAAPSAEEEVEGEEFILEADGLEMAQSVLYLRGFFTNPRITCGQNVLSSPKAVVKLAPLRLVFESLVYNEGKRTHRLGRSVLNLEQGVLYAPRSAYTIAVK